MDEGDEIVRVAGTASGTTLTVSGTDLTIIENDAKGIVLAPSAVSPTEGETTGEQYTVRLASEPTGTVTVHADAPAGSDVRVASSGTPALTASLTFTTTNWETPQPFTVTAVEDADGEDDTGLAISHRVAGADYEGLTVDDTVAVTIDDDDVPGIQVAADPATAMVEEGQTIDLDVKLNTQPTGNVTVTLTVPSELSASSSTLTFTTGNWDTVQTVTVEALDDDDAIPDAGFTIVFAASGADYGAVSENFALTVTEDDTEALVVEPKPLEFGEGADGEITVKLASEPAGPVTVRATLDADADPGVTVIPVTRRFTPSNWDQTKTFTVAGAEDADSDDDTATVTFAVDAGNYDAPDVPVAVTVDDDDVPSTKVMLTVAPSAGIREDAGGARGVQVTGTLDGAARGSDTVVTVTVSSGTATVGTDFDAVADFPLTILADQTSGTAVFDFTPVDDDVFEGDETVAVSGQHHRRARGRRGGAHDCRG